MAAVREAELRLREAIQAGEIKAREAELKGRRSYVEDFSHRRSRIYWEPYGKGAQGAGL
ncbi:hypothetical protein JCM15765_01140 [Paradesulfitobacterium aromaticivorans]